MEDTISPWTERPLLAVAQKCARNFSASVISQPIGSSQSTMLSNQLDRLKIWAGHMGVSAAGKASADYRLRHDHGILLAITMLIDRINRQLESLIAMPQKLEQGDRQDEPNSDSSESISESSFDDSDEKAPANARVQQHSTRLEVISCAITDLYRLSAVLKKPEHRSDALRIERFAEKRLDMTELDDLASYVRWKLDRLFPDIQSYLFDRMLTSVIFRRKKIMYQRSHAGKLREGAAETFEFLTDLKTQRPTTPSSSDLNSVKPSTPLRAASSAAVDRRLAVSTTTASSINRLKVTAYPKSLALSHITGGLLEQRQGLDVPSAPKVAAGATEAVCNYCMKPVKAAVMQEPHWT